MDYNKFKESLEKNKQVYLVGISLVVVFFLGFGVGKYDKYALKTQKSYNNYNTNTAKKVVELKATPDGGEAVKVSEQVKGTSTKTTIANSECLIKGNISSTGRKLYHVKGGASYNKVKPEQCFNSNQEAEAAGFLKASR